ncbi:sterol O-acyltransferase 1-like isoform X2 [Argiope bruennichi]|uniref:sterol O-acyltransferase 1-like isoform X2 n=1 Tax=Argiope bruennichi TaxID=94029 RepID=UPI00249517C8|nr:sterol O-acyltransferase 1-like isoform X2 [Argiope bruennichi]
MAPNESVNDINKPSKTMNGSADVAQEKENVSKKASLPKKVFRHRNSVLTDLMEVNHLQTVYNISVAIVVLLFLNSVIYYLATPNKFWEDIEMIRWGASNVTLLAKTWISFNILAFLVFFGFKIWVRVRNKIHTKIADFVFLWLFIATSVLMFVGTAYVMLQNVFKPIIHFSIMCEQVRIYMKVYSFVRESAPRVLQYKPSKDGNQEHNLYPTIKHYTFYLFAPVLIYRDSYPRRKEINYKFALAQLFKFFACIFICYSGILRFMVDVFQNTGITPFSLTELSLMYAGSMVIGALTMFVMFYAVLHSWLNFFAEMLRFGDREFYQDWWNSTSFSQYYRKWNIVVHDWLYTYIYAESIDFL